MRKTKIICTLGPASDSEETVTALCRAGMNVARMNFSHNTHADHKRRIDIVKRVREELVLPVAVMLDTKGPEYRIGTFEDGKVTLCDGDSFTFTIREIVGNRNTVSVSYKRLTEELRAGDIILLSNGLLSFEVTEITDTDIMCKVLHGGELSDRKSMSFPNKVMKQEYLSNQDKSDILFGVQNGVDFIACSFVSRAKDIVDIKDYLKEIGADDIELIAKIENQSGVDNIEEICDISDGVMIARGDMGVEIPFERLPAIQKRIISECRRRGKYVIIATEMLESMIYNPRPTRAEISDVANAVYDGASAVMLSGETAAGKFPVEATAAMAKIAETAEENIHYDRRFKRAEYSIASTTDAISHSACAVAIDTGAKAIVACSLSGKTANMVSRFRPPVNIVGLTADERTSRALAISFGVVPTVSEKFTSTDALFHSAKMAAKETFLLKSGDKIVIVGGDTVGMSGNTNLIKIEEIE